MEKWYDQQLMTANSLPVIKDEQLRSEFVKIAEQINEWFVTLSKGGKFTRTDMVCANEMWKFLGQEYYWKKSKDIAGTTYRRRVGKNMRLSFE
jgi:alkylated DNA repair dioxygenase AlkB